MNFLKSILLFYLFLISIATYAQSAELKAAYLNQAMFLMLAIFLLFRIKLEMYKKFLLLGIYLITAFLVFNFYWDDINNSNSNSVIIGSLIPPFSLVLAYIGIKSNKRKSTNPD